MGGKRRAHSPSSRAAPSLFHFHRRTRKRHGEWTPSGSDLAAQTQRTDPGGPFSVGAVSGLTAQLPVVGAKRKSAENDAETGCQCANIKISLWQHMEKIYDPRDTTLKFVERPDSLNPVDNDNACLRAEMSCGHAVTPESLTLWCRMQLDEGIYKFTCPAIVKDFTQCRKPWSYQEIRRLADLSVEEMQHFEETIARLAAAQYCEVQPCPQCKTNVERKDLSNLCVRCTICTADQKKTFQFCWQCMKQWKGSGPQSDRCSNDGCINKDLQLLQTCQTFSLPAVEGVTSCPSVRACPTCGMKVQHNQQNCKNIICPRCHVEFCFVCLKLKRECKQTSSPYKMCPGGVAPRQTLIPVWKRKFK